MLGEIVAREENIPITFQSAARSVGALQSLKERQDTSPSVRLLLLAVSDWIRCA